MLANWVCRTYLVSNIFSLIFSWNHIIESPPESQYKPHWILHWNPRMNKKNSLGIPIQTRLDSLSKSLHN